MVAGISASLTGCPVKVSLWMQQRAGSHTCDVSLFLDFAFLFMSRYLMPLLSSSCTAPLVFLLHLFLWFAASAP